MKKGFLYTFVTVIIFGVFLVGNNFVTAQTSDSLQVGGSLERVEEADLSIDSIGIALDLFGGATSNPTSLLGAAPLITNAAIGVLKSDDPLPLGSEGKDDNYFTNTIQTFVLQIMIWASKFVAWIVSFTGKLFDMVIRYTTGPLGLVDIDQAITASWRIVRDFSNIILVFSLLYLGIKTILEGNGFADKKTLIGIIMAAIMINFSLFLVKDVAFNISNTVGQQILTQANLSGDKTKSFSEGLMGLVSPQVVLDNSGFKNGSSVTSIAENDKTGWGFIFGMMGQMIMFTVVVLCMAFVFIGMSIMLLYRFFIFVVLMIFAPIGLISTQIPWLQKLGKDWSENLKKQTIFFPAFALVLYIILLIVSTLAQSKGILDIDASSVDSIFSFLFRFILIMGFMFSLFILPGKMGAAGAGLMTSAGGFIKNKARSLPLRTAAGGSARAGRFVGGRLIGKTLLTDSHKLKKAAQGTGAGAFFAQMGLKAGAGLQKRTFDARNLDVVKKSSIGKDMGKGIKGYSDAVKDKKTTYEKRMKEEKELFGFDDIAKSDDQKVKIRATKERRDLKSTEIKAMIKAAKLDVHPDGSRKTDTEKEAERFVIVAAEKELEKLEQKVGEAVNVAEFEYLKQLETRWISKFNPKITSRDGIAKMRKDVEKKWKKEGQSTTKRKDAVLLGGAPSMPSPTPPPATP